MRLAEGAQRFQLGLNSQNPTAADSWIKPAPARPAAARFSYTTPNRARRNTGKNTSDDLTQDALESGNMRSLGSHYSSAGQVVGLFGSWIVRYSRRLVRGARESAVESNKERLSRTYSGRQLVSPSCWHARSLIHLRVG
jgi:hypothetical protein